MTTLIIVLLFLLLIGAIPVWPYSRGWGYGPSAVVTILVIVLLVLLLTGNLRVG